MEKALRLGRAGIEPKRVIQVVVVKSYHTVLGGDVLRRACKQDIDQVTESARFLSDALRRRSFLQGLSFLLKSGVSQHLLRDFFVQAPADFAYLIFLAGSFHKKLSVYGVISERQVSLSHLLRKTQVRLCFRVRSVADLHAARGFIRAIEISDKDVVIQYGHGVDKKAVQGYFPSCLLTDHPLPRNQKPFMIRFDTEAKTKLQNGGLVTPHDPYKGFLGLKPSARDRNNLRQRMGIGKSKKMIVFSCSTDQELWAVVQAFKRLPPKDEWVLVIGLRKKTGHLAKRLAKSGMSVYDRRKVDCRLESFGRAQVVVLSTRGELFPLMKAADLAIVGHDRNLFEPALLSVPILYFNIPLEAKTHDGEMTCLFNLFWRKNKTAKRLLEESGGAVAIDACLLREQMAQAIQRSRSLKKGIHLAMKKLDQEIFPAYKFFTSLLLSIGILSGVKEE